MEENNLYCYICLVLETVYLYLFLLVFIPRLYGKVFDASLHRQLRSQALTEVMNGFGEHTLLGSRDWLSLSKDWTNKFKLYLAKLRSIRANKQKSP